MYPTESLILYVVDHKGSDVEKILIEEINRFASTRKWAIVEPNVIVTDDEIYGVNLTLYSATKSKLPKELDRLCYQDAEATIQFCKTLSATLKMEFEVDYHDECIGGISDGRIDKSLQKGLLDEWKKVL